MTLNFLKKFSESKLELMIDVTECQGTASQKQLTVLHMDCV